MFEPCALRGKIVGHPIVLHEAPKLLLILRDDAEICIKDAFCPVYRFSVTHVALALRLNDIHGDFQADRAIGGASSGAVT